MGQDGTVILCGGIGGHELWLGEPTYRNPRVVWLSYTRLALQWPALSIPETRGAILPGVPLPSVYDLFASSLSNAGWVVRKARLDWRDTIAHDGFRLVDDIRVARSRADGPVHLVGHSRGGLVMRSALGLLRDAGQSSMVGRCVGIGVPHRGSWAIALLLGGDQQTGETVYNLLGKVGARKADLNAMIDSWPACYELLPENGSAWLSKDDAARCFSAAAYGKAPVQQTLLDAGKAALPAVPDLHTSDVWLDVIGVGNASPSGLAAHGTLDNPATVLWDGDGDGVVARESYEDWLGAERVEVRLTHDRLVQDGQVVKEVDQFLRE
jgi:pimeloyl-ACP methyl ester carboxylesterase